MEDLHRCGDETPHGNIASGKFSLLVFTGKENRTLSQHEKCLLTKWFKLK